MALSKRSVVNLNFLGEFNYAFINHYISNDGSTSPYGSAYSTGSNWNQIIDSDGWPNASGATQNFGGSIRVPDPAVFSGPYVITWDGDGTVSLQNGTWTVNAGASSNYTENSNGNYTNTAGQAPYIVVSLSGITGSPQLIGVVFTSTNPGNNGRWLRNFKFYRQSDETDLTNGNVFRTGFKQPFVALNPSAIRVMNWSGGSASTNCRWENRNKPSAAGFAVGSNYVASPPYGSSSGTNTLTLASATGMPVAMTHGEMAIFRVGSNGSGNYVGISSITNANPGVVTTASAHGFSTGDRVVHRSTNGMTNLDRYPVTVTVINSTQYSIGVDTTSWGAYTNGGVVCPYVTMDVGSRGEYPIVMLDGNQFVASYGDLSSGSYQTLIFDKTISAITNGAGSLVASIANGGAGGVWRTVGPNSGGHSGEVPVEMLVALCNEVNSMSVAQGINNPVGLWINVPPSALMKGDPDYSTASDWAYNLALTVMNGANGYAGLTSNATLFVEHGNENWNSGGGFWGTFYNYWRSYNKWSLGGTTNPVDMPALRSIQMVNSIKDALPSYTFPDNNRIKFILGIQPYGSKATFFQGPNQGDPNYNKCFGTTITNDGGYFYVSDILNTAGTAAIYQHDAVCLAPYLELPDSYLTGTFSTDADSYVASPSSTYLANAATQAQATGGSIDYYSSARSTVAGVLNPIGKNYIEYEGGQNWPLYAGKTYGQLSTITLTANEVTFLMALTKSTQWRDAQLAYFTGGDSVAGTGMPAVYIPCSSGPPLTSYDPRWAYSWPDSYYGSSEGVGLGNSATLTTGNNPTWVGMAARNQAINESASAHHGGKGLRNF